MINDERLIGVVGISWHGIELEFNSEAPQYFDFVRNDPCH